MNPRSPQAVQNAPLPHLLVVGLETPLTLARQGSGRGQAGGAAAAAVRSEIILHPPPHVFFNTNPIRLGREQGDLAALQEMELVDAAAARLQGTTQSRRSLLELMWPGIATALRRGTGATAASGQEAPARYDVDSSESGSKSLGRE